MFFNLLLQPIKCVQKVSCKDQTPCNMNIYIYIAGGRGLCTGDVSVENTLHLLGRNTNKYYNYLSPMVHLLPSLKMQSAPPVSDGIGLYIHFGSLVEMRSKYSTKHNRWSHSQGLLIIRQSLALYPGDNIKGSGSMNLHNKYQCKHANNYYNMTQIRPVLQVATQKESQSH